MLDKGLTEDGAGQALGWPKARVTARVKLLELPEKARELVGAGVIPLSAVDQLRAIGRVRDHYRGPVLLSAIAVAATVWVELHGKLAVDRHPHAVQLRAGECSAVQRLLCTTPADER